MQFQKISILLPQKGLEFPEGVGGSVKPKNLKKCMKLTWNFQRGGEGGGGLKKIPSVGEVWIFSGITHYYFAVKNIIDQQISEILSLNFTAMELPSDVLRPFVV